MNVEEITARLHAIGAAILDKTGETPWLAPALKIADGACEIELMRAYDHGRSSHYMIGTAKGDTPEAALDDADRMIDALIDQETANLRHHIARVSDCIEKAGASGISEEYIGPMRRWARIMQNDLTGTPEDDQ